MRNVRNEIAAILTNNIGVNVYNSRIQPIMRQHTPAINIQTAEVFRNQLGYDMLYDTTAQIDLYIHIANNDNYANQVDSIVANVITLLANDADFVSSFRKFGDFKVEYYYENAGEVELAQAILRFQFNYQEKFEILYPYDFESYNVDIDYIAPINDKNIKPLGPDGRIEGHIEGIL